jgi:hypothetical protein
MIFHIFTGCIIARKIEKLIVPSLVGILNPFKTI